MKKIFFGLVLGLTTLVNSGHADTFGGTGEVSKLRAHQLGLATNWVTVEGFTSAGSCSNKDNGMIKLQIADDERGDKQLSILLAAKMAGQEVYVTTDDAGAPNCLLRYIDLL